MIPNHSSTKSLKLSFFPNFSVLEAKNMNNSLYEWKSILKGREVIKRGTSCRIGNGRSIHILGDNWLPTKSNPKIISPNVEGNPATLVSSLIDLVQKIWREDIIYAYFYEFEAGVIKNIPLCRSIQDDDGTIFRDKNNVGIGVIIRNLE